MTTKKVTNTLLSFLRKPSKAAECQTVTFEEFQKQFTDQIDRLEKSLLSKNEEKRIIEKDIERMKHSLEVLALERSQRSQDLNHLEQKVWEMRNNTEQQNQEIEDLKEKVRFWMYKCDDLERLINKSAPEVELLHCKLQELKQ